MQILLSPTRGVLVPKEGLELALNLNRHRASRPLQVSAHVLLQPRQQLSLYAHLIKPITTQAVKGRENLHESVPGG
jgi:hypothetical protein